MSEYRQYGVDFRVIAMNDHDGMDPEPMLTWL